MGKRSGRKSEDEAGERGEKDGKLVCKCMELSAVEDKGHPNVRAIEM